jgi:hypothetical protein
MREVRPESGVIPHHRVLQELQADLIAEVTATPPIVVSAHERDGQAGVHQLAQQTQNAFVPLGNAPTELEPEVEEVSVEDQERAGVGCSGQPRQEGLLLGLGRRAEVDVGGDVDRLCAHRRAKVDTPGRRSQGLGPNVVSALGVEGRSPAL